MACIYGDVMKIDTTGASEASANQDDLPVKGVEASKKLAEHDLARMEKYKSIITKVGKAKKMDPAVIAGIISRESRAGNVLKNGWDTKGNGFGLMQVDKTQGHTPVGAWDSEEHITQATGILIDFIKKVKVSPRFSHWTQEQCFKGGIVAYHRGMGGVPDQYENIDVKTAHKDYSNDVVARAQWYRSKGY